MLIEVQNTHCVVRTCTDEERRWLTGYLTFPDKNAHFSGGPATVRGYDDLRKKFPRGFISLVQKGAATDGIKVELLDTRVRPCEPDPTADLSWLRWYQREAVAAAVKHGQGIIQAATGAGKGEILCGIARLLPCKWLFLVHRAQLADDIADRWEKRFGEPAGRVGDGRWTEGRLTCATLQSLYLPMKNPLHPNHARTIALLEGVEGILCDEAHVVAADSYGAIARATKRAFFRIGLSGTPLARGDKRSIFVVGALAGVIYKISAAQLIEEGVLSKPTVRMVSCPQESSAATHQGVYGELIVRSRVRNRLISMMARAAARPGLIFVKEVKHGQQIVAALGKMGLNSEFVWGALDVPTRQTLIKRLVRGELDFLVCSVVFQEGIDIPSLRSVIIAAAGQSVIAALQRIGRGMRAGAGKTTFEVWDLLDGGDKWMTRHAKKRFRAYTAEGHEVQLLSESQLALMAAASGAAQNKAGPAK